MSEPRSVRDRLPRLRNCPQCPTLIREFTAATAALGRVAVDQSWLMRMMMSIRFGLATPDASYALAPIRRSRIPRAVMCRRCMDWIDALKSTAKAMDMFEAHNREIVDTLVLLTAARTDPNAPRN